MDDDRTEAVVALSHWRAVLARSRNPRKRLDLVLEDAQAADIVPAIPIEEIYYLIRGVGLDDAGPVLQLMSGEQLQGCLDLDLWERDRLSRTRIIAWMEALAELPSSVLARFVRALDEELVALVVGRYARVYDHTAGEVPDEDGPHIFYRTPDTVFVVEMKTSDATAARTVERFLSRLYDADPDFARTILMDAKWGLTAELEEESHRWRTARLADLGFPSFEEAVGVYQPLDPGTGGASGVASASGDGGDARVLPMPFAEMLGGDSLLERALAAIDDADLMGELARQLVALLNRVLVADRVDAADLGQVRETTARARDTISLGLDHLSGGDLATATAVLSKGPLIDLFRIGYALVAKLLPRARALDRAGVIDPNLDTLLEPRALFPRALDPEPTAGMRPFRTVSDVQMMDEFLRGLERTLD